MSFFNGLKTTQVLLIPLLNRFRSVLPYQYLMMLLTEKEPEIAERTLFTSYIGS